MVKTRTFTLWCSLLMIRPKNDQRASITPLKGAQQIQDGRRAVLIREPPDELIRCETKSSISVLLQLHHSNVRITEGQQVPGVRREGRKPETILRRFSRCATCSTCR